MISVTVITPAPVSAISLATVRTNTRPYLYLLMTFMSASRLLRQKRTAFNGNSDTGPKPAIDHPRDAYAHSGSPPRPGPPAFGNERPRSRLSGAPADEATRAWPARLWTRRSRRARVRRCARREDALQPTPAGAPGGVPASMAASGLGPGQRSARYGGRRMGARRSQGLRSGLDRRRGSRARPPRSRGGVVRA